MSVSPCSYNFNSIIIVHIKYLGVGFNNNANEWQSCQAQNGQSTDSNWHQNKCETVTAANQLFAGETKWVLFTMTPAGKRSRFSSHLSAIASCLVELQGRRESSICAEETLGFAQPHSSSEVCLSTFVLCMHMWVWHYLFFFWSLLSGRWTHTHTHSFKTIIGTEQLGNRSSF